MFGRLAIVALAFAMPAAAQDEPNSDAAEPVVSQAEMTTTTFEMFRMVPGKLEEFIRSMALYDQVSMAGGQPPTQLFLHAGGEGWDVLLYKPSRPVPTPDQEAAMARKIEELGLPSGPIYFLKVREKMADHTHFEATGPTTASAWLAELDQARAEAGSSK